MPAKPTFDFDDLKTVDDNLAAFVADLTEIDAGLAAALAPRLGEWSRGKEFDHAGALDELFAATAPEEDAAQ